MIVQKLMQKSNRLTFAGHQLPVYAFLHGQNNVLLYAVLYKTVTDSFILFQAAIPSNLL